MIKRPCSPSQMSVTSSTSQPILMASEHESHRMQLLSYLKISEKKLGLFNRLKLIYVCLPKSGIF